MLAEVASQSGLSLAAIDRLTPSKDQFFASGRGLSTKRLQRCARGESALGVRAECYYQGQRMTLLNGLDRIAPGCKVRYLHPVWRALEPRRILCGDELAQMARELGTDYAAQLASALKETNIRWLVSWFEKCPVHVGDSVGHAELALMLIARRGKAAVIRHATREERDRVECAASEFSKALNLPDPDRNAVLDCASLCGCFDGEPRRGVPRFMRL